TRVACARAPSRRMRPIGRRLSRATPRGLTRSRVCQPTVVLWSAAVDNGLKLFADPARDRSLTARLQATVVDFGDGYDLRGGASQKRLVGNVNLRAWNTPFDHRQAHVAGERDDRITGDSIEHAIADRRCAQHTVADDEHVRR